MLVTTKSDKRKMVKDLSDSEIDGIAWLEAEQSVNHAIHDYNYNECVMKYKAGEAF